jgi:hypothetical protein
MPAAGLDFATCNDNDMGDQAHYYSDADCVFCSRAHQKAPRTVAAGASEEPPSPPPSPPSSPRADAPSGDAPSPAPPSLAPAPSSTPPPVATGPPPVATLIDAAPATTTATGAPSTTPSARWGDADGDRSSPIPPIPRSLASIPASTPPPSRDDVVNRALAYAEYEPSDPKTPRVVLSYGASSAELLIQGEGDYVAFASNPSDVVKVIAAELQGMRSRVEQVEHRRERLMIELGAKAAELAAAEDRVASLDARLHDADTRSLETADRFADQLAELNASEAEVSIVCYLWIPLCVIISSCWDAVKTGVHTWQPSSRGALTPPVTTGMQETTGQASASCSPP